MALVDYRGYRVIATCLLPVSPSTLIYGSADGGMTAYAKNEEFNRFFLFSFFKLIIYSILSKILNKTNGHIITHTLTSPSYLPSFHLPQSSSKSRRRTRIKAPPCGKKEKENACFWGGCRRTSW